MQPTLSVSQCLNIINDMFEATYPVLDVAGEVSDYKEWNNRLVFFSLKDETAVVGCMIPLAMLKTPLEEGMQVRVSATPKVTQKGRFNLNVRKVDPVGEGALRRAFELLKTRLEQEGLFAPERKRALPRFPARIAVVTSLESAAYQDFLRSMQQRWGGVEIVAVHTQVQGEAAPEQIEQAISYVNQLSEPVDAMAVIRGGGSLEDLAAFNNEPVVRAIAASRVATVVGVGHETDTSLADMAADVRATTPTDTVRHLVPDRHQMQEAVRQHIRDMTSVMDEMVRSTRSRVIHDVRTIQHAAAIPQQRERVRYAARMLQSRQQAHLRRHRDHVAGLRRVLEGFHPRDVLRRGYAVVRYQEAAVYYAGHVSVGDQVVIQLHRGKLGAEVTYVETED